MAHSPTQLPVERSLTLKPARQLLLSLKNWVYFARKWVVLLLHHRRVEQYLMPKEQEIQHLTQPHVEILQTETRSTMPQSTMPQSMMPQSMMPQSTMPQSTMPQWNQNPTLQKKIQSTDAESLAIPPQVEPCWILRQRQIQPSDRLRPDQQPTPTQHYQMLIVLLKQVLPPVWLWVALYL